MADTLIDKVPASQDLSGLCEGTEGLFQRMGFKKPVSNVLQSFVDGYVSFFPKASQAGFKVIKERMCKN
jgi:hypothetical protein